MKGECMYCKYYFKHKGESFGFCRLFVTEMSCCANNACNEFEPREIQNDKKL